VDFDFLDAAPPFQRMIAVCFLAGFLAAAVAVETVVDGPSF